MDATSSANAAIPSTAAAPQAEEVKLPAELWANILHYSLFDEVLAATAASKSLLHDVPPKMKHLLVGTAESMDVSPAAVRRFDNVTDVFVYSLIEELGDPPPDHDIRLDPNHVRIDDLTIQMVVPFLTNLSKLTYCHLGGFADHEDRVNIENGIRCDVTCHITQCSHGRQNQRADLIRNVCEAYREGSISGSVDFNGLLPLQTVDGVRCAWRKTPQRVLDRTWQDEVDDITGDDDCQVCRMICTGFPPLHVMEYATHLVPCVSPEERLKIAKRRDPDNYRSNLTQILHNELPQMDIDFFMLPPDFSEGKIAIYYDEAQYSDMEYLISKGADMNDPRLRTLLLGKGGETGDEMWLVNHKRVMTLDAFRKLKKIGFDICEKDFVLVDASDKRTSVYLSSLKDGTKGPKLPSDPESVQKVIDKFVSEKGVDLTSVRKRLKMYVDKTFFPSALTFDEMLDHLKRRLRLDIDGHEAAIYALILEVI